MAAYFADIKLEEGFSKDLFIWTGTHLNLHGSLDTTNFEDNLFETGLPEEDDI